MVSLVSLVSALPRFVPSSVWSSTKIFVFFAVLCFVSGTSLLTLVSVGVSGTFATVLEGKDAVVGDATLLLFRAIMITSSFAIGSAEGEGNLGWTFLCCCFKKLLLVCTDRSILLSAAPNVAFATPPSPSTATVFHCLSCSVFFVTSNVSK